MLRRPPQMTQPLHSALLVGSDRCLHTGLPIAAYGCA